MMNKTLICLEERLNQYKNKTKNDNPDCVNCDLILGATVEIADLIIDEKPWKNFDIADGTF